MICFAAKVIGFAVKVIGFAAKVIGFAAKVIGFAANFFDHFFCDMHPSRRGYELRP